MSDTTGTIKVTFAKNISQAYVQVIQLTLQRHAEPDRAERVRATGNNTNPYTANLPAAPLAGTHFDVYFLDANEDLSPNAPTDTPAVTNLIYQHAPPGAAASYTKSTPSQNESFAGGNKHWATIAVEIKRP